MRYFPKAGNIKTKISRVCADLTQGLCLPQDKKPNGARHLMNFSSDKYPWLASRRAFKEGYFTKDCSSGVGAHDTIIYYVQGGWFYYDSQKKFEVSAGKKKFFDFNGKILIFPDMMYYNPDTDKYGRFGITTDEITYQILHRTVGTVDFGLAAIQSEDINLTDYFKVGDGIKITEEEGLGVSGFHTVTGVNKEYGALFFDKFEFGDGEGFTVKGKISNGAPEVCDAACVCGGRVWVAGGNKIQATTINDESNWAVGGDDEKSSFICDIDSEESITACVEFEGAPVFFSERKIYKIYGDRASNFHLKCCSNWGGIPKRMSGSVAVLKDRIFYVSEYGVTCFDGSSPRVVTKTEFPIEDKVYAASDGKKYYVYADNGDSYIYVYDDMSNQWQIYGEFEMRNFLPYKGAVYACAKRGIYSLSGDLSLLKLYVTEQPFAVSADFSLDVGGKSPLRLGLDLECDEWAYYEIYVSYDSEDDVKLLKTLEGEFSGVIEIPLVPRGARRLTVGLVGEGDITIKELYADIID